MEKDYIEGAVVSGLGEGAFFMSIPQYKKQIKEKLGLDAYAGTLNLKIKAKKSELLADLKYIKLNGFEEGKKNFGGVMCYKAKINNIKGYIIDPEFTRHKQDIIEFIAPMNLRSRLRLQDNDKVMVELI